MTLAVNEARLLSSIRFNADGLVPAVAQCAETGRVLMLAWMNSEAVLTSLRERRAVYFSRSRGVLWRKGETSGHVQHLRGLQLDCDGDTLLLTVSQVGGIACHTGRPSCFYREWVGDDWREIADRQERSGFDAESALGAPGQVTEP